jgi:hypothetical protein
VSEPSDAERIESVTAFLETVAGVTCERLLACSTDPAYPDEERCKAEYLAMASHSPALTLPSVRFDSDAAAGCLAVLEEVPCEGNFASYVRLSESCGAVFTGEFTAGSTCSADQECAAGLACDTTQVCPSTCQPIPQAGQACTGRCEVGLTCHDGTCQQFVALGRPCGDDYPICEHGLRCARDADVPVCEEPGKAALGERCDDRACADGLACVVNTQTQAVQFVCAQRVPVGSSCSGSAECEPGSHCSEVAPQACVEDLDLGEACDSERLDQCAEGSCIAGVCAYPKGLDELCTVDAGCYSGNCAGDRCGPAAPCP